MTRGQREEATSGTAAESKSLPSINKTRFGMQHFVVFLPRNDTVVSHPFSQSIDF